MTGPVAFDPGEIDRLLELTGDELDEARHFLRHLLDEAPVSAVVAHVATEGEPHFELDFVSDSCGRVVDLPADQFKARFDDWSDRLDPNDRGRLTLQYLQLVRGEIDAMNLEVEFEQLDGTRRGLNVSLHCDPTSDLLFGYLFDVTGQVEVREELADHQRVLHGVIDESPDIFVVTDLDRRINFVNPVATDLIGYAPYQLMGQDFSTLIHPDDCASVEATLGAMRPDDAHPGIIRTRVRHHAGHWATLDIRARLLVDDDGVVTSAIGICRDATSQIQLEHRLREAKETAERASRAKDEFLSRMSHELRTPLNAVLGFAQLLDLPDLSSADRESVDQIRRAGGSLLQLIDEVLDIARIDAGKMTVSLEPVDLHRALTAAVDLVRPLAADHDVHLEVGDARGQWVRADSARLGQVLLNLLTNAIKFNRPGGSVEISANGPAEDGTCRIIVTDTGHGIDGADLDRLFEPFERLEADHHGIAGTGIGLALSRALTRQMGGTLTALSKVGEGTTLALTLEVDSPRTPGGGPLVPLAAPDRASGALRILHIEDNEANRDLIDHAVRWRGRDALVAADQGLVGLALAEAEPPDVVLLDLHLPDMDGVEVIRRLRTQPATASTPVIVLSADATSRQIHRMVDEGADHYLTKPIDLAELLDVLERYRH